MKNWLKMKNIHIDENTEGSNYADAAVWKHAQIDTNPIINIPPTQQTAQHRISSNNDKAKRNPNT